MNIASQLFRQDLQDKKTNDSGEKPSIYLVDPVILSKIKFIVPVISIKATGIPMDIGTRDLI